MTTLSTLTPVTPPIAGPVHIEMPPANNPNSQVRPTLITDMDLPGPLSLRRLAAVGAVYKLDETNAYISDYGNTLYGRGIIVHKIAPYNTVACAFTAAWVWVGGEFPKTIDIVSASHFRSLIFGRKIRVFNRNIPVEHRTTVGDLHITTPARTACDIALLSDDETTDMYAEDIVLTMMESYHFSPSHCLDILQANRFWTNAPRAREFFLQLERQR